MKLEYKEEVEEELKAFFYKKKKQARKIDKRIYDAVLRLEEYTLRGGKRIRPILAIKSYLGYSGKNVKEMIKLSVSIELLQSFFLIHDDWMDEDDLRRGKPTIHSQFRKIYTGKTADSLAIDLGDLIYSYSFQPILDSNFENKSVVAKEFVEVIEKTCYGQFLDLLKLEKPDANFIEKIHRYKTAEYTFSGPLKIGAILAGTNPKEIKKIEGIGRKLGLAFQLKDDILGVFGDEEKLGKPIGSDLKDGKKTLLILKARSKFINEKIGRSLNKEEIGKIREIIKSSGSLEFSEKLIVRLLEKARKEIKDLEMNDEGKKFLINLAEYMRSREN